MLTYFTSNELTLQLLLLVVFILFKIPILKKSYNPKMLLPTLQLYSIVLYVNSLTSIRAKSGGFIMSHSLLWRGIVLLTVGVYSNNHGVLYTIGINITRRFQKSVSPSVWSSICNPNKKVYSIINSRITIRISGERA